MNHCYTPQTNIANQQFFNKKLNKLIKNKIPLSNTDVVTGTMLNVSDTSNLSLKQLRVQQRINMLTQQSTGRVKCNPERKGMYSVWVS